MNILKSITVGLFTIALVSTFNAQEETPLKKFKFGIKGITSLSFNKPDNKLMENDGAGFGLGYGLMAEKRIERNYALLFGLDVVNYKNKIRYINDVVPQALTDVNGNDSTGYFPGSSVYTYKYGVVNLPISLKMSTNQIGYISYYAQFGVEMGVRFRTDANVDYTWAKTSEAPVVQDLDVQNRTNPLRLGLLLGAGLEWNLTGNTNLLIGLTYHNGFTNIFKGSYTNDPGEKVDNRTVEFSNSGDLKFDANGNILVDGEKQKAFARYVALNVGIYF